MFPKRLNKTMFKESNEPKIIFNNQAELEKLEGVLNVQKIELDSEYFDWAKKNLDPKEFEKIKTNHESLEIFKFSYISEGLTIGAYMWIPKNVNQKLPLTIWNRGGTKKDGSNGNEQGKRGPLYSSFPCELAKLGSVVVGSEYRGGIDSEGADEWGGRDVDDVVRLHDIIKKSPTVISEKSVVVGWSRGGMMSYLLASKEPWVKAVVSLAGGADLEMAAAERPEMKEVFEECFGGSLEEMKKRSATHFYPKIPNETPILIIQGFKDKRVSVEEVRKLVTLLKESKHNVEYHEFSNEGHYFHISGEEQGDEALKIIEKFMKAQLSK